MTTNMKTTAQLKIGDTIKVWWRPGRDSITALRPYTGPLRATLGDETKVAEFALNETGMTLEGDAVFEVL
jgi:hypothetical protein